MKQQKDLFEQINDYNTKVITFGFAAFFALAALVKDSAPKNAFVFSIFFMTLSTAIFVLHEVIRYYYLSINSSNKAKAIENLPDENILRRVEDAETIFYIRLQKWNKYFFIPSLFSGLIALIILFYCYWLMIVGCR